MKSNVTKKKISKTRLRSSYIAIVVIVFVLVATLASCINPVSQVDAAYINLGSPDSEISVWLYPIGEFSSPSKVNTFIQSFNKKYPDITVKVEYLDYATGDDRINAAVSAGTAPDIVMEGPERIVANWGTKGYMADLSDMWTKEIKTDISSMNDSVVDACKSSDGKYYEYPICATAHCMAVNYDVFEQAGALKYLDLENHTWTTDGFRKACQAVAASGLVASPGVVYCGGQGGDQGTRALVTNLFGADFTNKKNTKYTVDSPEGVEALNYIVDMTKEGSLSYDTTIQANEELDLFARGKVAMTFAWNSSHARIYSAKSSFKMFPMAFPTNQSEPELCSGIWGFGVFDNGNEAKIENSKKFIDFLCNDKDQAVKSVRATGFFPVRSSLDGIYNGSSLEELMAPFNSLIKYNGNYYNITPGWTAQRTSWWSMLQKVFSGTKPEIALAEYSKLVNGIKSPDDNNVEAARKRSNSRVLFISSNSLGYPGVNEQIDGIREGLGSDAFLHCEFMDSTSISGDAFVEKFYHYICDKYEKIGNIGAVIVGGDNALKMAIRYQSGFFSNMPVLYESINSSSLVELADSLGMKGVYVSNTIMDNLDLACKIKPNLKKIYIVSDNSSPGQALSAYVNGIKTRYSPRKLILLDTSQYTSSEIKGTLSSISDDSMVLYMTFTTDSRGNAYRYDHAVKMVTQNAKVPVLSLTWMGNDTLGSVSIDYSAIGRQVGFLANDELGIADPAGIRKINLGKAKSNYKISSFDVSTMRKFRTSRWVLPRNTVYYNGLSTIEMLTYIIGGLLLAIVMFIFLAFFYRADSLHRKANELLLIEKNKQITEEAEIDTLTGLGNRRLFDRDLQKSLNSGRSFTLFLFDLDKFKTINDTYGHLAGDAVLKETGQRLLSMKVRSFVPYRYGGDEFAALYFHSEADDVAQKADQIVALFNPPIETEIGEIKASVSIGSADFPAYATNIEELIQAADKALYYVKENGRNGSKRYSEII